MSLVSVIIPAYNCEKFLGEAVESVFAQTYSDVETIIVDDGSRDGTHEAAARYARRPGCRLFTHEGGANRGVSESRALGIAHAQGDYIAFLDADDIFEPDKLAVQIDAFGRHPDAVLCHGTASVFHEDAKDADLFSPSFKLAEEEFEYRLRSLDSFLLQNPICNSTVLARADAVRGGFIASRQLFQFEDWLNWIMLGSRGTFVFLPRDLIRYRYHAASATAALLKNDLRHHYSYLEMLLTLSTRLDGFDQKDEMAALVASRIEQTLSTLAEAYAPEGSAAATGAAEVLPRIARALRRGRANKTLFGRCLRTAGKVRRLLERSIRLQRRAA